MSYGYSQCKVQIISRAAQYGINDITTNAKVTLPLMLRSDTFMISPCTQEKNNNITSHDEKKDYTQHEGCNYARPLAAGSHRIAFLGQQHAALLLKQVVNELAKIGMYATATDHQYTYYGEPNKKKSLIETYRSKEQDKGRPFLLICITRSKDNHRR